MTDSVEELSPISFKSILPDSKDVRVTNINGVAHVWAVDLVFAMKGKTRGDAARLLLEEHDHHANAWDGQREDEAGSV